MLLVSQDLTPDSLIRRHVGNLLTVLGGEDKSVAIPRDRSLLQNLAAAGQSQGAVGIGVSALGLAGDFAVLIGFHHRESAVRLESYYEDRGRAVVSGPLGDPGPIRQGTSDHVRLRSGRRGRRRLLSKRVNGYRRPNRSRLLGDRFDIDRRLDRWLGDDDGGGIGANAEYGDFWLWGNVAVVSVEVIPTKVVSVVV